MLAYILSKLVTLTYGLMYPAYCSFKAVKTKDVREYVNWMMYWIAFALFSVIEVFADTFVGCWFPFYYEGKIIFLLWMISSSTRGGAVMYRRYIHPALIKHEEEIDACLADFKAKASSALMKWGYRVLTSASEFVMSATFRQNAEPLLDNFRRTYSMNDINRGGYGPRYLGPPGGGPDLHGRAAPPQYGDIYFDRNVPAQIYGDVHMGDGSDGNEDRTASSNNNESAMVTNDQDNRRLRSSTRKRHVEQVAVGGGGVADFYPDGIPLHLLYGWYPTSPTASPASSLVFPPNFDPVAYQMALYSNAELLAQRRASLVITEECEESDHSDEFYDCDVDEQGKNEREESSGCSGVIDTEGNELSSNAPVSRPARNVVKTVGKTVLQTFDAPVKDKFVDVVKTTEATTVPHTRTAQALIGKTLQVASSVTTPAMASEFRQRGTTQDAVRKIKHSSSFTSGEEKQLKSHSSSWHPSSFRRVFHPFSSTNKSVPVTGKLTINPGSTEGSSVVEKSSKSKSSE